MRIVGEKGGAAFGMGTRKRPVVGGAEKFPGPGQGVPESIEPEAVEKRAEAGNILRIRDGIWGGIDHGIGHGRGHLPSIGS